MQDTVKIKKRQEDTEMLLMELLSASAPYLKRKKETPRSQCTKLNEVHKKVHDFIAQANQAKFLG